MSETFAMFDQVQVINLIDRRDRRREIEQQFERVGGLPPNLSFFGACRPSSQGEFPSIGARGCFESHLSILKQSCRSEANSVLIVEDDFDFTRDGIARLNVIFASLAAENWSMFYGAHVMPARGRVGLIKIASEDAVMTTSFVAFRGAIIPAIVAFLEDMQERPAGSPDWGPMHVDGAYSVFRQLSPEYATFAAFPALGHQRSSASDVTKSGMLLDRWAAGRVLANQMRRSYNWIRRR